MVWILAAIGLLLLSATLAIALLADRTVRKAGLAFRFDAAKKTLVLFGADGNEVKPSAIGDGGHALDAADQKVLVTWLAQHLEYRAAVDSDCACDEALRLNPGALPYTAASDFNHDGKKDFASGDQQENRKFALLIFNGPIGGIQPALFLKDLDLQRQGLFFDLPFEICTMAITIPTICGASFGAETNTVSSTLYQITASPPAILGFLLPSLRAAIGNAIGGLMAG